MINSIFNPEFFHITGDSAELRLIDTYEAKDGALPFYWWNIYSRKEMAVVGKISLRVGYNDHVYYNGHIGYEVDDPFRGNHYALQACSLLPQVARSHNMNKLYLTCNHDNAASYKTIEKLGATLLEIATPSVDYIYYYDGIKPHRIYELIL